MRVPIDCERGGWIRRENVRDAIKRSSRKESAEEGSLRGYYGVLIENAITTGVPTGSSVSQLCWETVGSLIGHLCVIERPRYTSTSCRTTTRVLRFSVHGFPRGQTARENLLNQFLRRHLSSRVPQSRWI